MNSTNESKNIVWIEQSPSSSTISTPTNVTQIASPIKKTFSDIDADHSAQSSSVPENKLPQPLNSNNDIFWIDQKKRDTKTKNNQNILVNNDTSSFVFDNTTSITEKPTIYP